MAGSPFDETSEEVVSAMIQIRYMSLGRKLSTKSSQSAVPSLCRDDISDEQSKQMVTRLVAAPAKNHQLPRITSKAQLVRRAFRKKGRVSVLDKGTQRKTTGDKRRPSSERKPDSQSVQEARNTSTPLKNRGRNKEQSELAKPTEHHRKISVWEFAGTSASDVFHVASKKLETTDAANEKSRANFKTKSTQAALPLISVRRIVLKGRPRNGSNAL